MIDWQICGRKRWLKIMLNEIIFSVKESMDGGYEATAVGHSIYTQCDDCAQLQETLRDAVKCHFDEAQMPTLIRLYSVTSTS